MKKYLTYKILVAGQTAYTYFITIKFNTSMSLLISACKNYIIT